MKLLKASEMKEIDQRATSDFMIPSLVLMENAGLRLFATIKDLLEDLDHARIVILAGQGNNGGDGLVLARHLINHGAQVDIFLLGDQDNLTQDAAVNYAILERMQADIFKLNQEEHLTRLVTGLLGADLIVDAIYGIGFRGSLNDFETRVVKLVNRTQTVVLSVDIPSGVEADSGKVHGSAVKADYTVTMARPKLGNCLPPGVRYNGELSIADISIPVKLMEDPKYKFHLIEEAMVKDWVLPRQSESHKGTYGHVLVIGGSPGMTGAVMMTSLAALRSGAGLVTAALPESLVTILESAVMEVMSRPLLETNDGCISLDSLPAIENMLGIASVCVIGPGMSRYREANPILRYVLENSGVPVLIDADGLNALEGDTSILKDRQIPIIITPHPGEMSRLTGLSIESIQENRIEAARSFAVNYRVTVVLKGHQTVVAAPSGEVFINNNGNPGMATAGSGDVLSGIIAGLVAQGLRALQAAVAGVFIHGHCGDQATHTKGQRGLIAGDLIDHLPHTIRELEISL